MELYLRFNIVIKADFLCEKAKFKRVYGIIYPSLIKSHPNKIRRPDFNSIKFFKKELVDCERIN